jgi:hypothetical protein
MLEGARNAWLEIMDTNLASDSRECLRKREAAVTLGSKTLGSRTQMIKLVTGGVPNKSGEVLLFCGCSVTIVGCWVVRRMEQRYNT